MKKVFSILSVLFFMSAAFTESPELKNMMPNSWEKLTRLSESEEKEFIEDEEVQNVINQDKKLMSWDFKTSKEDIRVYAQTVNKVTFYRLLYCNVDFNDFLAIDYNDKIINESDDEDYIKASILQSLFVKGMFKKISCIYTADGIYHESKYRKYFATNGNHESDGGDFFEFTDIMIKPLNKSEIGFFRTTVTKYFEFNRKDNGTIEVTYPKFKEQLTALNKCDFEKVKTGLNSTSKLFQAEKYIRIDASDCLFDPKCPLKYSIQNAFDGNPATSYVENTEDDLMKIEFSGFKSMFSKHVDLAIINGYSLNEKFYHSNNRIISLNANSYKINDAKTELIPKEPITLDLKDNSLNYQIVSFDYKNRVGSFSFKITGIAKGMIFNDTCLAELNLKESNEFVFGEIND